MDGLGAGGHNLRVENDLIGTLPASSATFSSITGIANHVATATTARLLPRSGADIVP